MYDVRNGHLALSKAFSGQEPQGAQEGASQTPAQQACPATMISL